MKPPPPDAAENNNKMTSRRICDKAISSSLCVRNVSFVQNRLIQYLNELYWGVLTTDVRLGSDARGSDDHSRGFRRVTCIALRVQHSTRAERHFSCRLIGLKYKLVYGCDFSHPPAAFLFRRWVERSGHTYMVLATPHYIIIVICG